MGLIPVRRQEKERNFTEYCFYCAPVVYTIKIFKHFDTENYGSRFMFSVWFFEGNISKFKFKNIWNKFSKKIIHKNLIP